ncbi:MAG: AAA family ATPase [Streptosporangiales bacterium]|nr:AAA family ATPase [Streptosporangiales bacterium]
MLLGRAVEQASLDRLVAGARTGQSGVLVLRGEAGIGKTALLEYAAQGADGMRVLRGVGVEAEAELPFAGLHLLVGSFRERFDALPALQAAALRGAFGEAAAPAGADRFLVGLATLSLLAELAEDRPVLCLVDDAHWLDGASADALLFAARRLGAEGVGLVFAARDGYRFAASGVPEMRLDGLDDTAGRDLLRESTGDLARPVRDRILQEARGNPLALVELANALTPAQRAGEAPAGTFGTMPLSGRVEQTFADRIRALPRTAQDLLLVAAADDTGLPDVILEAGALLGVSPADLELAEEHRLLRVSGGRLMFTHPLIRSAAYQGATSTRRSAAHRALADSYGGDADAARRAWQLAAAALGVDEEVASELEKTAEQARARGGYAAVAAAYERSAQLTPDPRRRTRRLAVAAEAAATAGRPGLAARLVERAAPYGTEPEVSARLVRVRAAIAHEQDLPTSSRELAEAATALAGRSPDTAGMMLLEAVMAMLSAGEYDAVAETARRVAVLPPSSPLLTGAATVVAGLSNGPQRQGMQALREVLGTHAHGPGALGERAALQAGFLMLDDVDGAYASAQALVRDCRAAGAIGLLPRALMHLGRALLLLGRYQEVRTAATEGLRIADDTTQPHFAGHLSGLLAHVAAIEGDVDRCAALTDEVLAQGVTERGAECVHALSVLDLAFGRYDAAFARLERIAAGPFRPLALSPQSTPYYVEAAARVGHPERGTELCAGLDTPAEASGLPWSEAVALRCRALVAGPGEAGDLYAQALQRHARGGPPFEQARTELLYGEWLRRQKRRTDCRPRLRAALETFERLGAAPWAQRARTELRAAGETPEIPRGGTDPLERLTPQELQIVRMAADGMSNRDIAAQLFLSPRTVGYHLYKAYPKLGIASRNELVRMNVGR